MKSFNEILEEKLQQTKKKNINFSHFSSENAYDLYLNTIPFEIFQRQNSSPYSKIVGFSSYKVEKKQIKPKPHVLNTQQKVVLDWFISRGAPLSEAFTKTELIKSFRQLAFVLHPDYNRAADAQNLYRDLHENKEILMQVFQN
jgi:hypothetical protein